MINPNIQKTDVLKALAFIDKYGVADGRESTKYQLIHNGKNYPPKYVISIAQKFLTGIELAPDKFSGGKQTNGFLEKRGFIITGETKLTSIIQLENPTDYKLHFATGEGNKKEALTELYNGTFDDFQNKQSRLNFSRKYILALVYLEEGEWLFAGIYESISYKNHPTDTQYKYRYNTVLTEQYQEYIGKLIIKYDKNFRQSYPYLENHLEGLMVSEILDKSLLETNLAQDEVKENYYQRAYKVTKRYIDPSIDLPLKEAKQLIAGNGNHNTANYHIYGIKGLLLGERFTSKLTEESLSFYISYITREFGVIGFNKAVIALEEHLRYRIEKLKENPVSFKKFIEKYRKKLTPLEDEIEQAEILQQIAKEKPTKESLIDYFKNLKSSEQEKIAYNGGKAYKRDNVTVANLKKLRNFTCQICQCQIKKADSSFYIEAAHIYPKALGGEESLRNLLILCPNHHKEFDYGQREIFYCLDFLN